MAIRSPVPAIVLALGVVLPGCGPATPHPEGPTPAGGEPPPAERARARPPADPPTAAAAERFLLDEYVEPDTLTGLRDVVGRFRHLGGAAATELLPDQDFCHVYFALDGGTWCYRAVYREPFRTRRVDAFSRPRAPAAGRLLAEARAVPYGEIRDLLFLIEHVEAEDLACATFFVRELLVDLEGAEFETLVQAPTGLVADGIACADRGGRWTLYRPAEPGATYRLWDRAPLGEDQVAVILREGDEVAWLEAYALAGEEPRLLAAVELWP